MIPKIKYFFLTLFCFSGLFAKGQTNAFAIIPIKEENTSLKINTLYKSVNGVIWAGTTEGLFKISGHKSNSLSGLPAENSSVTAIGEDKYGVKWIGTSKGTLYTLSKNSLQPFTPSEGLPKEAITHILCDSSNNIWFATAGEGLYLYNHKIVYNIDVNDGLSDDYVNCLYTEDGKTILAGTDRGISTIKINYSGDNNKRQKNITTFTSKNGLPDNIVKCFSPSSKNGIIWVGTQSKGIVPYNIAENRLAANDENPWSFGQVNDIAFHGLSALAATEYGGIVSVQNGARPQQILRDSALSLNITQVIKDNEGNIWFSNGSNLVKSNNNYFNSINPFQKATPPKINVLAAAGQGSILFSSSHLLYHYNIATGKSSEVFNSGKGNDITAIHRDSYENIWIGTMGGLYKMNLQSGKKRKVTENALLASASILCVSGKGNEVWVSSLNGVAKFVADANIASVMHYNNYPGSKGIGSDYVYAIYTDSKNRTWFATDGAGVSVMENGTIRSISNDKNFAAKVVYAVSEDNKGNIWFNTLNNGLYHFDGKKFENYEAGKWFADRNITSFITDKKGRVIVITKKGVDVLDPANKELRHHGMESGFGYSQSALNAIAKDEEGNVWIGTDKGLVMFSPENDYVTTAPKVLIENILLFNEPMSEKWRVSFSHDENNLTFYYTAISYTAPEKITYQYFLEGFDDKWINTKDQSLVFSKLNPGKYVFKIRASSTQNFEASPITSFAFEVKKPFWLSWWFIIPALLALAGGIYFAMKYRLSRVRKKEQAEKERFQLQYDVLKTQVNPHFLFNSFNALMNVVEEDPKAAASMIKHLSRFYRKMTAYRNKDVILVEEELELLQSYFYIQQKRFGNALIFDIDLPESIRNQSYIPPFVLQLLAENAVKHNALSAEKPLVFSITEKDEHIVVANNINPKISKEESEGLGLQNITNRYKVYSGRQIQYGEAENRFIVKLPILKL